jgi:fumarate reductase subunit C
MSEEALPSPGREEHGREAGRRETTRVYRRRMSAGWWTRNRHYFLYTVREFTALPLALWLLWLLVEIKQAGDGPGRYAPHSSPAFVVFSVIVLLFALYHSVTFLSLSGLIIRVKVLDRPLPPRLITTAMFGLWAIASVVIAAVLIGFGR